MPNESDSMVMPPYISFATFTTLLDWLHEMRVVPLQFDRSLWSGKFSGSTGAQLVTGLRFLRLLDGDKVLPLLEELAQADNGKRKSLVKEILRDAYQADFVDQFARKTPAQLEQQLKTLGSSEATLRKAVSFFVNASRYCEIPMQPSVSSKAHNKRPKAPTPKPRSRDVRSDGSNGRTDGTPHKQVDNPDRREAHHNTNGLAVHPLILALINDLEKIGPNWTTDQRDAWVNILRSNLDYAYPVKPGTTT